MRRSRADITATGEEGLLSALEEGEIQYVMTSSDLFGTVKKVAPKCKTLKCVIYTDEARHSTGERVRLTGACQPKDEDIQAMKKRGIDVLAFDHLMASPALSSSLAKK